MCCCKGCTISIPGVYIGILDKIPFGAAMNKGLTMKMARLTFKNIWSHCCGKSKPAKSTRHS